MQKYVTMEVMLRFLNAKTTYDLIKAFSQLHTSYSQFYYSVLSIRFFFPYQFVQKKDPNYKELKEDTAWSMDKFNAYINEHVRPNCPVEIEEDWVYNSFTVSQNKLISVNIPHMSS